MPQDSVTTIIPNDNRKEICSLKIIKAIRLVITISKLLNKDALEADVIESHNISKIGAITSKQIIKII